jgi:hypothetical protein
VTIDPGKPGCRWLLIRRNRRTAELAFYRCYCPGHVPLPILVKIAGIRVDDGGKLPGQQGADRAG